METRNAEILNAPQFVNTVLKWTKMGVRLVSVMIHAMVTPVRKMKSVLMLKKLAALISYAPQSQCVSKHDNTTNEHPQTKCF